MTGFFDRAVFLPLGNPVLFCRLLEDKRVDLAKPWHIMVRVALVALPAAPRLLSKSRGPGARTQHSAHVWG